jgi:hypothetical protein
VRKYLLLGDRFVGKQLELVELVEQNYEIGKYLDALIYQTRLSQRCYDLRWEIRIGDDIAELHTVRCAGHCIVVVATVGGKLIFVDEGSGRKLDIRDETASRTLELRREADCDVLAPFDRVEPIRTLACAVACAGNRFRVAVSCAGRIRSPGVAIIDVRPHDARTVIIETIAKAECDDENDPDARHARVYALQPLPDADDFVAGLETRRSPVGRLRKQRQTWRLELAKDGVPSAAGLVDRPSLAPGKMPARALAVAAIDDKASRYLLVAGSDDGLVRATLFGWGDSASRWQVWHGDRLADAISSIALSRDPGDDALSCYVGTNAGDSFAFSVRASDKSAAVGSFTRLGDHDAEPLWRETHEGPVLAVRLWRTPLYETRAGDGTMQAAVVLAVATEKGRLCIYNHSPNLGEPQVSASCNYYFRGMRFDRVTLPGRVSALSMTEDKDELVAAGEGGQLYKARLVYLRDSALRQDPEGLEVPVRSGSKLPTKLWERQRHLLAESRIEKPFDVATDAAETTEAARAARRHALKLELCDLIRLEGGPLAVYALRERLWSHEPWNMLGADELRRKAQQLLGPLRPEKPEDAEKIKVILKTLCRSFLFAQPSELRSEILRAPLADPAVHAQTAATCEVVAEYITHDVAHSTRGAARLRMVAIKELLRVQALRQMAIDDGSGVDHGKRIRTAIEAAIDGCLRDDERLVRIETLRALSVLLRNVGAMVATVDGDGDRERLLAALFPEGLGSLTWLLALIVGGLQRFPSFTRRTALVSDAWYYINALLGFFQVFPDRTLALCDYLVRHGLGIEVLAMCHQSLPSDRAATTRNRIANLYLLPVMSLDKNAKAEFLGRYDIRKPGHRKLLDEIELSREGTADVHQWYELDDATMARRLIGLLDRLARMWSISDQDEMSDNLTFFTTSSGTGDRLAPQDAPAGMLESVVDGLAACAVELAKPTPDVESLQRLSLLGSLHGPSNEGSSALTTPLRAIVAGVVDTWREVYSPTLAERGTQIGNYKLGAPFDQGGFGRLFAIDEPLQQRDSSVIKVLNRNSPRAAARFLEGARFNKELCDHSPDGNRVVQVTDLIDRGPRLAYVMRKYRTDLEKCLSSKFASADSTQPRNGFHEWKLAISWTVIVAVHVGQALRAAHSYDRWHGDVKASNILVDLQGGLPTCRLGDFDLASDDSTESSAPRTRIVPPCLLRKALKLDRRHVRQWEDIAALSLILYRMLTGEIIDTHTPHLRAQVARLHDLTSEGESSIAVRIIQTLMEVFDDGLPPLTIHEFLRRIDPPTESPEVKILFLGANPSSDTELALTHEVNEIRRSIRNADHAGPCRIEQRYEVRADRLYHPILEVRPHIVHFGCHGNDAGELVFHGPDRDGTPTPAPIDIIAKMFRILREQVRCVVLSACYAEDQAKAISEHIDVVIGMTGAIPDRDAIDFAAAFYGALGLGSSVQEAFKLAALGLEQTQGARREAGRDLPPRRPPKGEERPVPQLHVRPGFDASTLYFVKAKSS